MSDKGADKISLRVSKELLQEIDGIVSESSEYSSRSDLVRDLLKKCNCAGQVFNSSSITVHNRVFREVLRFLKKDDIEKATSRTSSIIHSIMQEKKKSALANISEAEALMLLKEIYESTNMVSRLHIKKNEECVTVCASGDNLCSPIFASFLRCEMTNVMKPWMKLKNCSETSGNLVLTFG